jgi:tetratricopeptide (TPR) repeat protein
MECPFCGFRIPSNARACPNCSAPIPASVRKPEPEDRTVTLKPEGPTTLLGQTIDGRYKLLEEIGSGGMGVVYLAEQVEPVRRRVALKVIKLGMDTKSVIARFEAERQALAVMSHPNIARVFDAGATAAGRPYFVMELVQGVPITDYCDRNTLTTTERLELLIPVCEAVQHAHQKGVIHRDLKPSNILVSVLDGRPQPKIIDFGIARATSQRLSTATFVTEQGQMIGTPDYMSPEQAEMSGLDVDTRTDIYSLGVILYQLLTGDLPFDPARLRAGGMGEIQKMLREVEPPKASTRVGTRKGTRTEAAEKRRTDPGSLRRLLRGDLDWITMRAMAKDRTRRYASASELAADIERHLHSEPVLAGPPRASYRIGKYIRRHKVGVAAAGIALAAVLVGTAGTSLGFIKARRAERKAVMEAETAKQVSDFLVSLFAVSDPSESRGNTVTAREILDQGAARIEKDLAGQPLTQARLMTTIGDVYKGLGLYAKAGTMLDKGLALRRERLGEKSPEVLDSLQDVGDLRRREGKYDEAERTLKQALAVSEAVRGTDDLQTAIVLHSLGVLYDTQGRFAEAESLLRRAVAIREKVLGPADVDVARSLNSLAVTLWNEGRYADAESALKRSLAIKEKALGENHPDVANTLTNLGILYKTQGNYRDAEPYLVRSLAVMEKVYGPDHPDVADNLNNLAVFYEEQKKYPQAEAAYKRALAIWEKALGPEHSDVGIVLHNMANLYRNEGKFTQAEPLYLRSQAIWEKSLGPDHPYVAASFRERATLYREMKKPAEAESLYKRALVLGEKNSAADPLELAQTLTDYAALLRDMKRDKEAAALEARAKTIQEKNK